MRALLDTNVFLEVLLKQERSEDVKKLLSNTECELFISDFSLHSIGILPFRTKQFDIFREFVTEMVQRAAVGILALSASEFSVISDSAKKYGLDFDDAYQYSVVTKYGLTLISFDTDFDRTDCRRKTPRDVNK